MRDKLQRIQESESSGLFYLGVSFILVGVIMIGMGISDIIASKKPVKDFNNMTPVQCEAGIHVKGEVAATVGYYWESYSKRNGVKMKTSTKRIYLIPFGYESDRFIGINVDYSDFDTFEQLKEQTYQYLQGNAEFPQSIGQYEGYVKKCDARMRKALKKGMSEFGQAEVSEDFLMPYYIELHSEASGVISFIAIVFILAGIVVIVVFWSKFSNESINQAKGIYQYVGMVIYEASDSGEIKTNHDAEMYVVDDMLSGAGKKGFGARGDSTDPYARIFNKNEVSVPNMGGNPYGSVLNPENPKPVNYGRPETKNDVEDDTENTSLSTPKVMSRLEIAKLNSNNNK